MAEIRHSNKRLSAAKVRALEALARKIDAEERSEIVARGRVVFRRHRWLRGLVDKLKEQRKRAGLSLADVARRSGIAKPNLSRLENDLRISPTLDTLQRYARAVGKDVHVELVDADAA